MSVSHDDGAPNGRAHGERAAGNDDAIPSARAGGPLSDEKAQSRAVATAGARTPIARRTGRVAELARLRARIHVARMLGDVRDECDSARALAERLASREVELDVAVELALRTLTVHDDDALRQRLAGWLERLGEPSLAAAELHKLPVEENAAARAARLMRIGVLHARAGDASGASDALAEAAAAEPAAPLALELLATIAAWAPDTVSPRAGANAYAQAAKRRAAAGDVAGEQEDLFRAVELDATAPLAVAALVSGFERTVRPRAADLLLSRHAEALLRAGEEAEAQAVHERRVELALEAGDLSRALSAAFDAGMDGAFEGKDADTFDDLLARVSAFDLLAARLEVRAERAHGRQASLRWAELGRLAAGPLGAQDRALEAYARAVAADATNAEAVHSLRALSRRAGSTTWLLEGLIRAARGDGGQRSARVVAARTLAEVAENEAREPFLASWANSIVAMLDPSDEGAHIAAARHETALRRRDEELALARRALETSGPSARAGILGDLARLLRSAPDASGELARVLAELASVHREDDLVLWEAIRIADRESDLEGVVSLCRDRLSRPPEPPRVRIALVAALRRIGNEEETAQAAEGLALAVTPWAFAVAWTTARLAGDSRAAAEALAALAAMCAPSGAATFAAVAAAALARIGETAAARRAAEQACRADPEGPRAALTLAELVASSEGRVAKATVEHALEVGYPTAALATRLAEIEQALGQSGASIGWAKRAITLKPGVSAAVQALVDRALGMSDVDAAVEALGWLLPQPEPSRVMAERYAPALRALAERDPTRACEVARRALDVLGPRHSVLRAAIEEVARIGGDGALRAVLAERWLAAGAPGADMATRLLEVGAIHASLGDAAAELSAYVRAARAGAELSPVKTRVEAMDRAALSADAELAWLEVSAELAVDEGRTDVAITAFRELGAAFWDMADDRPRAVQAWVRAAQLDSARGYSTLRRDLIAFADAEYAVEYLAELVEREPDRSRCAMIATEAARAALEAGAYGRALALARTALEKHAGNGEPLELAERAARGLDRAQDMAPLYDHAARRALGRFGRRAAHHRAARFFSEGGVAMLALKHAAQAFIAVPSEGSTLDLLRRTADQAQRRSVAVRTVEHVAELSRSKAARAAWLCRAAELAARDLEGTRQRVDLLLRAAVLVPTPGALALLASATKELLELASEDVATLAVRLRGASDTVAKDLEGPDGARIAIAFAQIAMDLFGDAAWALRELERALATDADVDEYARLVLGAGALARAPEAKDALDRAFEATEKPYANIGVALLRLMAAVANALGDHARAARALVLAVEKDADDDLAVAEADEALRGIGDDALKARFARRVDDERLFEALRSAARAARQRGDLQAVASALGRARALAPEEARGEVDGELSAALSATGRVEEALRIAVESGLVPTAALAARWEDFATAREREGELEGAAEAFTEAARLEGSLSRWSAAERVADASKREDLRVAALRGVVSFAADAARRSAMKRLARAEGARGALDAAEAAWREVWAEDPADPEPDVAIEALLVARGDYERLAAQLARRVERLAGQPEALRAVRLRRAAILEQRLGRLAEAASELERVLEEAPGHVSALRWLADLYDRMGEPARAVPALERLAEIAGAPAERKDAGVRRVRALLAMGESERAREAARELAEQNPGSVSLLEVRVEVARASKDPGRLGDALAELARVSPDDTRTRSEMLVEAAQAAARAGDTDASLARARDAARLAPDSASTQLFARGLEYRLRGAGSAADAQSTVEALGPLLAPGARASLAPEDVALGTFLLAEARDVIANGTGEALLREVLAEVGPQPLVGLGLAERAAVAGRWEAALRFYLQALEGNLLGLRRVGRVALAAAAAAGRAAQPAVAGRLLGEASLDPETRVEALRMQAQAARVAGDTERTRSLLRGLVPAVEGEAKAEVLAELARSLSESPVPGERLEAERTLSEAIDLAPPELAARLRSELDRLRARPPSSAPLESVAAPPVPPSEQTDVEDEVASPIVSVRHPPFGEERPLSVPPSPRSAGTAESAGRPRSAPPPPLTARPATATGRPPSIPAPQRRSAPPLDGTAAPPLVSVVVTETESGARPAKLDAARVELVEGDRAQAERLFADAMREGSLEAADALDALLASEPGRSADLLKVRRQAVELRPGDMARLTRLRDAAHADKNPNYVRAIEHVLRAFDGDMGPLPPPPLGAQSAQPGMMSMLTRHSREPAGEVFAAVWEGARGLFTKPPTAYGTSGLDRVQPGPNTPLSRLYEIAVRLLDTPRFALFHHKGKESLAYGVALLESPSAILTGEAREDGLELRWMFGKALASVLPENALPLGLPDAEGHVLWRVLMSAFGPPSLALPFDKEGAALADRLWQTLPARAQRRITELLSECATTPFELVLERTKQSGRRVGMFLTGDFGHAARAVVSEAPGLDASELSMPGGLAKLCIALPALADLYRLAVRPEYADARWYSPAPTSQRLSFTGGLSVV